MHEGPMFSTRAESNVYRQWGCQRTGMDQPSRKPSWRGRLKSVTAHLPWADYDCWHVGEEAVTLEMMIGNLNKNAETAKRILKAAIPKIEQKRSCACATAVQNAIVTNKDLIPKIPKRNLIFSLANI